MSILVRRGDNDGFYEDFLEKGASMFLNPGKQFQTYLKLNTWQTKKNLGGNLS
jgi:hypothetical protein